MADAVGDGGGQHADEQLAEAGEPPGPGRDPGDEAPASEQADRRTGRRGPRGVCGTEDVRQQRDERADREGEERGARRRATGWAARPAPARAPRGRGPRAPPRGCGRAARRPARRARGRRPGAPRSGPAPWPRPRRCASSSSRSFSNSCSASSAWERDRDVLPRRHREGAGGEAGEAGEDRPRACRRRAAVPPATPAIRAKFDTRPSIAPNTAGRSQPPVTSRWWSAEVDFRSRVDGTARGGSPSAPAASGRCGLGVVVGAVAAGSAASSSGRRRPGGVRRRRAARAPRGRGAAARSPRCRRGRRRAPRSR